MMADAIAQGIAETDPRVAVKTFNISRSDKNDILTNVFQSKGVLVGSSTMNNVMMPKVAGLLEEISGLRFRNKKASAFGSCGWSGGAVDRVQTRLMDAGFDISMSLKAKWRPDLDMMEVCREHGREIARNWALSPIPALKKAASNSDVIGDISPSKTSEVQMQEAGESVGQCMICSVCQWVYDPAKGEPNQDVAPGTEWANVPEDFLCPDCGIGKSVFDPYEG
jgi:anaerobic nitric oxide reductase flavorubredoxin